MSKDPSQMSCETLEVNHRGSVKAKIRRELRQESPDSNSEEENKSRDNTRQID